ncbi:MAG: addiction module toxin, HicA family [Gammaproteobacteria bacterium]|nr:addiction module toxin, HicA family [Gammaproteobacteria bacterium]
MSKVPSLNYATIIKALQRDGWVVVRQRGSHIRLQKHLHDEVLKITVPAHKPIKRSTLSHILKQARISVHDFFEKNMMSLTRRCTVQYV